MPPLGIEVFGPGLLVKVSRDKPLQLLIASWLSLDDVVVLQLDENGPKRNAHFDLSTVKVLQVMVLWNLLHAKKRIIPGSVETAKIIAMQLQAAKICEIHHRGFNITDLEVPVDPPQQLPPSKHFAIPLMMFSILQGNPLLEVTLHYLHQTSSEFEIKSLKIDYRSLLCVVIKRG